MRHFFHRLLADCKRGENIDLVATVLLALTLSILHVSHKISAEYVQPVIMATLAWIAVNLLVSRHKLENAFREANLRNKTELLFKRPPLFEQELAEAKEIQMLGLILKETTNDNYPKLKERVLAGAKLTAIICNPDAIDLDLVAEQFTKDALADQVSSNFQHVRRQYTKLCYLAEGRGPVQLKQIKFVPSFGLCIFHGPKGSGGVIYVEIYGYKSPSGSIPKFRLTEHDNPEWYNYYLGQFQAIDTDSTLLVECLTILSPTVRRALDFAAGAHAKQVDKAGKPYIEHLKRVAIQFSDDLLRVIGLLHDIVEDTDVTLDKVKEKFGEEVSDEIDALTKRPKEPYEEFIKRVAKRPRARKVKMADLQDNLQTSRRANITAEKADEYLASLALLAQIDRSSGKQ